MSSYFSSGSLAFLHDLAKHNNKTWFNAHKTDYETQVREPFLRLITDLQPALAQISPHFRADPRTVGGSLFRIYRDCRFSRNKSPYKTWQGARLFHHRHKQVPAPSFYIHLAPNDSFVGGGIWHPESHTQRRIRQFIFDNPVHWQSAAHTSAIKRRYQWETSEKLTRPPRGFPADFAFIDDLKQRNWVLFRPLSDSMMNGMNLRQTITRDLKQLAPFMDYLCAALELEF